MTASFMMLRGTQRVMEAFAWLKKNWDEWFTLVKDEEIGMSSVFYAVGAKCGYMNWSNLHAPEMHRAAYRYAVPSNQPTVPMDTTPGRGIHFALGKWYLMHTGAWSMHNTYMGWRHRLIEPYANLPWPDPERARGSE